VTSSAKLLNAANIKEINKAIFMKTLQKAGPRNEAPRWMRYKRKACINPT